MTDVSAQAKFQIVQSPQAGPGCCAFCGRSDDEFYIDTGLSIDYHGAVYIGASCLQQIAETAGYASQDLRSQLDTKVLDLLHELHNAKLDIAGLEHILSGYQRLTPDRIARLASLSADDSTSSSSDEADSNFESESQGGTVDVGTGEVQTPRQSDDEAMGNLRPTTVLQSGPQFRLNI